MNDIVLNAQNISKSFPGVKALENVHLTLRRGRLTALLGENGAGKSTLMNIIAGVLRQDSGTITLDGKTVSFTHPRAAQDAGIVMIYQELNLLPNLSVAENIFLGREPLTRLGFIDTAKMSKDTRALLQQLNLDVKPETALDQLRVGQQQLVEIAKAISCKARVIIMDEPTSAISDQEIQVLFAIIKDLKHKGVAIAYITHKLEELAEIGDDAVVMRDGRFITSTALGELSRDEIVRLMVGRAPSAALQHPRKTPTSEVLRTENLSLAHPRRANDFLVRKLNLSLRRGEVLGIFGLMGAGRTELLETIFGLHPKRSSGQIFVRGKAVDIDSPTKAIACGLALAPEDRKHEGLVLGMSVQQNTSLACLKHYSPWGFIDAASEQVMTDAAIAKFGVKTPSAKERIGNLSGGNQQKVILGKWLATKPDVLLLDEPTRGIDVGAKAEIYSVINALSESGIGVVVVSSELPEILSLADRIMVLCEGRKTAEFNRANADRDAIMKAALPTGVHAA